MKRHSWMVGAAALAAVACGAANTDVSALVGRVALGTPVVIHE